MDRKIVFWDSEGEERLTHTEMDDAIESILDNAGDIKDLPETIEVRGYARMEPDKKREADNALEKMLESLDDEYGDPDGGYAEPTDGMKEAAEAFVAAVIEEYEVWACEIVKRETVNTMEWIRENRPDWIEENSQ